MMVGFLFLSPGTMKQDNFLMSISILMVKCKVLWLLFSSAVCIELFSMPSNMSQVKYEIQKTWNHQYQHQLVVYWHQLDIWNEFELSVEKISGITFLFQFSRLVLVICIMTACVGIEQAVKSEAVLLGFFIIKNGYKPIKGWRLAEWTGWWICCRNRRW